jgi:hypothetical protein
MGQSSWPPSARRSNSLVMSSMRCVDVIFTTPTAPEGASLVAERVSGGSWGQRVASSQICRSLNRAVRLLFTLQTGFWHVLNTCFPETDSICAHLRRWLDDEL